MKRFALWHPTHGIEARTLATGEDYAWTYGWELSLDVCDSKEFRKLREKEGWRCRQVRIVLDDDERPAASTNGFDKLSKALREGM
jgi:hypothetical protein